MGACARILVLDLAWSFPPPRKPSTQIRGGSRDFCPWVVPSAVLNSTVDGNPCVTTTSFGAAETSLRSRQIAAPPERAADGHRRPGGRPAEPVPFSVERSGGLAQARALGVQGASG